MNASEMPTPDVKVDFAATELYAKVANESIDEIDRRFNTPTSGRWAVLPALQPVMEVAETLSPQQMGILIGCGVILGAAIVIIIKR